MSYLMMDLVGTEVSELEQAQLQHPAVGGVILFSRNFTDIKQLKALVAQIRQANAELLIAVDHEGGRVQRFRDGFSLIPAMAEILPFAKGDLALACGYATALGFVMASELIACDIDLSFAPVLDLNGISEVIGSRSFSAEPEQVSRLAAAWIAGMHKAGMYAVGKHFPGHGSVRADSHYEIPVDPRPYEAIAAQDLKPFAELMAQDLLAGVMPAHVIYPQVDEKGAGFSSVWLQQELRGRLQFNGVIFSDDLGMKGATAAGNYAERAQAALDAGCDMILMCNDPVGVATILAELSYPQALTQAPSQRAARSPQSLRMNKQVEVGDLSLHPLWLEGQKLIAQMSAARS